MARFTIRPPRREAIERAYIDMPRRLREPVREAVDQGAAVLANRAKELVTKGTRSGRWYTRYLPKRRVRASAPGEAPKSDTGELAASIRAQPATRGIGATVSASAPYAARLEFRMNRSFLRRAAKETRDQITEIIRRALRNAARRNSRGSR